MELRLKSAHCATERDEYCLCAVRFYFFDEAVDYQRVVKKELQGIKNPLKTETYLFANRSNLCPFPSIIFPVRASLRIFQATGRGHK